MRAPARRDPRHLGLVEDLAGPDPVRPDAGRVDDVRRLDLDRRAALPAPAANAARAPVPLEQRGDLEPVRGDRPEPLRLAEDRQDEADVVGLAVVEQVRRLRLALRQRRDQLDGPPRRGSSGAGRATTARVGGLLALLATAAPLAPLAPRPAVARHHVVHVQPDPDLDVAAIVAERRAPGTASDRRGAARAGPSTVARAAPRGRGRGRSSAGSEGRRGPSSRSGSTSRSPSRRARRSPSNSRARRRRARRRRRSRRRRSRRRRRARPQAPPALGRARSRQAAGEPDEADAEQCGQASETAEQDGGRRRLELVLGGVRSLACPEQPWSSSPRRRPGSAPARRRSERRPRSR